MDAVDTFFFIHFSAPLFSRQSLGHRKPRSLHPAIGWKLVPPEFNHLIRQIL